MRMGRKRWYIGSKMLQTIRKRRHESLSARPGPLWDLADLGSTLKPTDLHHPQVFLLVPEMPLNRLQACYDLH